VSAAGVARVPDGPEEHSGWLSDRFRFARRGSARLAGSMPHPTRLIRGAGAALGACALAATVRLQAAAPAFDPVAATEAYLTRLSPEQRARSDAYFEGGYWLLLVNLLVSLLLAWLLLRTGLARRLRDTAERAFQRPFARAWLFILMLSGVMFVLNLPMNIYQGFWREHHYQLSNQTFGGWFGQKSIGFALSLALMTPVAALLYRRIQVAPDRWWVHASVVTPFLLLFFVLIAPVFVMPLFNKYTPLADPALRDPILAMARANGVPAEHVYQFDASRQHKRVSANVSGALGTIRISLNDNLLNRASPAGVRAVMGHELGHYVLNHIYRGIIFQSLVFAAGFGFMHWFFGFVQARWGAGWGLRGIGDLAGAPVLMAGLALFLFVSTPVRNTITRIAEVEADYFGLNAAREPDAMAEVFLMLSEYRKMKPGPWEEILFFTHPSGYNRILAAMRWKAEHLAEPPPPAGSGD
jgi:STE24 endopeptidase